MKSFRLLAVAMWGICCATAQADPYDRSSAADPESAPSPSDVVPLVAAAYPDFPPYPPGFSSYRGLGFVGFCCEPVSACAQRAWAGYCDQRGCAEPPPTLGGPIHGWLSRPGGACCGPACGPYVNAPWGQDWAVGPSYGFGRRLRSRGYPMGLPGDASDEGEPTDAASVQAETDGPLPEPPVAEPPTSGRSAWRGDLRRLPSVEGSY